MLKKALLALTLLVVPVLLLAGCATVSAAEGKIKLGQEFTLPVGQSVTIADENLTLKFETVLTDSRAPKGAQAIWAGEAKCQLSVTAQGQTTTVVLTEKGGTDGATQGTIGQCKVSFQLQPYPEVGRQPAAGDYKLVLTLTKA